MKMTLKKILLGFLLITCSMIFTINVNGELGIFILTLLFVFSVSIFSRIIINKTRTLPYKLILGSPLAIIVSSLFYLLYGYANKDSGSIDIFVFLLKAIQIAVIPVAIGLILLLYAFVNKTKNNNNEIKEDL